MNINFKILIVTIAMLLKGSVAIAQLSESDTLKFQLKLSSTGTWQKGNVEQFTIRGKLELVTNATKNLVYKTQNNLLYQEFGNFKADNDINSRNYVYWKPSKKIYPFAIAYFQTNYRRKIDFRWFSGLGGTWQFYKDKNTILKFSTALVYENTDFLNSQFNQEEYNGSNNISLWRSTIYVSGMHKMLEEKFKIYYTAYWQPALGYSKNNRLQLDTGIEMPLWKNFNFLAQYTINNEQVVVKNVKNIDRILTFGLSYQLKK